jgi:hypothetical protein
MSLTDMVVYPKIFPKNFATPPFQPSICLQGKPLQDDKFGSGRMAAAVRGQ